MAAPQSLLDLSRSAAALRYNKPVTIHRRAPLGQVFLTDRRVEERITRALDLRPDAAVLEIGAGPGNMTRRLAARVARVWAVEVDSGLAAALRQQFADDPRVEVLETDILQLAIGDLVRSAGRDRIRVFGNLPYYITSPCLLRLFQYQEWIEEIVVMVQKEVAERIVAAPGTADYGLFSVTCQYYTQPALLFSVPPKAFRPEPQVYSAVVRLRVASQKKTLGIQDERVFWKLVRAAFAQRRKTLVNNWNGMCDLERLREALRALGIDPRARAETLTLAQFASLQRLLDSRK